MDLGKNTVCKAEPDPRGAIGRLSPPRRGTASWCTRRLGLDLRGPGRIKISSGRDKFIAKSACAMWIRFGILWGVELGAKCFHFLAYPRPVDQPTSPQWSSRSRRPMKLGTPGAYLLLRIRGIPKTTHLPAGRVMPLYPEPKTLRPKSQRTCQMPLVNVSCNLLAVNQDLPKF